MCAVGSSRDELDDGDAADLDAALADEAVTGSALARVLQGRGYEIDQSSVQRHRRGDCACDRAG